MYNSSREMSLKLLKDERVYTTKNSLNSNGFTNGIFMSVI